MTLLGNTELDLTRARLGPNVSRIELRCVLGSVTIIAPPDLRLDFLVDPVLGSAEVNRKAPSTTSADAPLVEIVGSCVMGSVEVRVVDPSAPGLLERIRRRLG